jgi:hypothetical protein
MSEHLSLVTGVTVDEAKWDGSDVCCFEDLGYMLVTEPLAERLIRARLVGVNLVDIAEMSLYRHR